MGLKLHSGILADFVESVQLLLTDEVFDAYIELLGRWLVAAVVEDDDGAKLSGVVVVDLR